MALVLKYTAVVSADCNNIILTDITGDYSLSNTTGYGSPNPLRSDITTAKANFIFPDLTVLNNVVLTLPTTQPTITVLSAITLGFPSGLEEGIYDITITETLAQAGSIIPTFTYEFQLLNTCSTQCCLDKQLANLDISDCSCTDTKLDTLNKIDYYLQAAKNAAECNKPNKAKKLLDAAQFLCNKKNCSC